MSRMCESRNIGSNPAPRPAGTATWRVVPLIDGDLLLEEPGGRLQDGSPQAARALRAA